MLCEFCRYLTSIGFGAHADRLHPEPLSPALLQEHHLVEHAIPGARHRYAAPGRGCARPSAAHLSPLGWEHVNLTGGYIWDAAGEMSETLAD